MVIGMSRRALDAATTDGVAYDGENRPVRWTREGDGKTVAMSFDHMGRRRAKDGQRFLYDGYLQVANERTVSSEAVRQSFVWDPTEPVATRPLAWFDSNAPPRLYTHDGNKNVCEAVAAASGTNAPVEVVAHYDYAAFGAVVAQKGDCAEANPWRFSSEYEDADLGLVYYNYRHYEPVTGRWMARDSIGEDGGPGLYLFIGNRMDSCDLLGRLDVVGGEAVAIALLLDAYMKMREANTKNADKWFHCMGMCRAARVSASTATIAAFLREAFDLMKKYIEEGGGFSDDIARIMAEQLIDSIGDMNANFSGISCPPSKSCKECCEQYRCQAPSINADDWF